MSTSNPPPKADLPAEAPIKTGTQLTVVQHSMLFYWWPVWAVGFLLALVTYFEGTEMAIVPAGTVAESGRVVQGYDDDRHDVLIVGKGRQLPRDSATKAPLQPHLRAGSQP
jgi:hypothetical protein